MSERTDRLQPTPNPEIPDILRAILKEWDDFVAESDFTRRRGQERVLIASLEALCEEPEFVPPPAKPGPGAGSRFRRGRDGRICVSGLPTRPSGSANLDHSRAKGLAKFAGTLNHGQRRVLGIRRRPDGKYPAPSQSTFSRFFAAIETRQLQQTLPQIQERVRGPVIKDALVKRTSPLPKRIPLPPDTLGPSRAHL